MPQSAQESSIHRSIKICQPFVVDGQFHAERPQLSKAVGTVTREVSSVGVRVRSCVDALSACDAHFRRRRRVCTPVDSELGLRGALRRGRR
jgi:hypothetical protein